MGRKWSLLRQPTLQTIHSESEDVSTTSKACPVELEHKTRKYSSVLSTLGVLKEHPTSKEDN